MGDGDRNSTQGLIRESMVQNESESLEPAISRGMVRIAVISIALCALLGCSFSESKKEAERLADQYFSMMQGSDMQGVLGLYSPRFYQVTSRADWLNFLQQQQARCGVPKTHALVTWNVFSSMGSDSGVRTILVYDVHYTHCRVSEKLTTFKPTGGSIQIQGHFLTPMSGTPDDKAAAQSTLKT